jgi:hexosaminidase
MLDVARHFFSVRDVTRYIDLLAYYKINRLHLHLTDDQGWRIEIRKHPKLTTVGSRFAPHYAGERNGYYSQAEIRELVRFAADRGVTLVPEIEMPGHCTAALAAYPELSCAGGPFEVFPFFQGPNVTKDVFCAGNEGTFQLLEDVLTEVSELFPGRFIHIGGDECPKDRWKACPKCQARMRAEGLADESALQSYFVRRIAKFLGTRKKSVLGWDEILEGGLAPDAAVMFWRGLESAAAVAKAGHDMVLSPTSSCYLDYRQSDLPQERAEGSVLPVDQVYSFDPLPAAFERELGGHVLGAQANMWTHYARSQDEIDRQMFPRLAALAEDVWTPQNMRQWADFRERLRVHCARLDKLGVKMGINFSKDPAVWADPARRLEH